MTRREFTLSLAASRAASAASTQPNVIIVLADDQGYGDFSCHGNPRLRTPNLDRLHGESVRLTDFHVTPMCTPTRAQLMTGRDCLSTRAMNVSSGRTLLRTDFPTMPEAFAAGGYRTALFGKWHLGDNYPYRPEDRGFREAVWYPSSHIGSVPDAWNNDYFNDTYRHNGKPQTYQGYCTNVFFDEAMRWMDGRIQAKERFFTYLALNSAHSPLFVPKEFADPYRDLPEPIARFYGMVANIDHHMGRLEQWLRDTGQRENTILVYFCDNGSTPNTNRFNAGLRGHKTTLWDGGHRVPLFARWPAGGIGGGRDIPGLTEVQDVFPTLAELCGVRAPAKLDGSSLAAHFLGKKSEVPERTTVVQFSRMNDSRPKKGDAAVLRGKWRLVGDTELYDTASDRAQAQNIIASEPRMAAQLREHYGAWWKGVAPLLDSFLPLHIGSAKENPTLLSACEWADVFLDQSGQVRRGERKFGAWHVLAEQAGVYEFSLRRWPRDANAALAAGFPEHRAEDGVYKEGAALPIAKARLKIGAKDQTIDVSKGDREAVFRVNLPRGRALVETWFLDPASVPITSAYYCYVERITPARISKAKLIFDTDIMGDVDDVGAVAALHALVSRGEADVLAMGVCSKHQHAVACLDALNYFYGRGSISIGWNKGDGFLRDSKYAGQIAASWKHQRTAQNAPDAVSLYRQKLAAQPDASVTMVSVGQLSNFAALVATKDGRDLVKRKVRLWVCMGAGFPTGREANIFHHVDAARQALEQWPTPVIFSGAEIGLEVLTGGALGKLAADHPVRKAYELYNGIQPHKSWDQTAVYYAVRGSEDLWNLSASGTCTVDADGRDTWAYHPNGRHRFLMTRAAPSRVAEKIEALMLGA